ncbi:hypothetical protein [Propioniciclava soli]|uniref:Uncharacterized protein n=1 Tax=Propioniciclava soli TaxID=2775081 RepID=A0ABZ3C8I8_9ACTN|nr:hypothetical protein [Propioniciclava soli]
MKRTLAAAVAFGLLNAGLVSSVQETMDLPPWMCNLIPVLCAR